MPRKKVEKSPFDKLPKTAKAVVAAARGGQRICKDIRKKETGDAEISWFYEPSGKRIRPTAAQRAIDSGLLIPSGDGLFDGMSQTWTAAP
jgi:hypothetical protein